MNVPEEKPSAGPPPPQPWFRRIRLTHLQSVQTVVAIITGLITIGTALYTYRHRSHDGTLIARVADSETQQPVTGATVDVLTLQDALVAHLVPDAGGQVSQPLTEGTYRLKVTHPNYPSASVKVQVLPQKTVDVRVDLKLEASDGLGRAKDALSGGAKSVGRALRLNRTPGSSP